MNQPQKNPVEQAAKVVETWRLIAVLGKSCAPSRILDSAVRQLKSGRLGGIAVERYYLSEAPEIVAEHGIRVTPTILMFDADRLVKRHEGQMTASDLRHWVCDG